MKKRVLSMLLVIIMVLSMLPISAFADNFTGGSNSLYTGYTIYSTGPSSGVMTYTVVFDLSNDFIAENPTPYVVIYNTDADDAAGTYLNSTLTSYAMLSGKVKEANDDAGGTAQLIYYVGGFTSYNAVAREGTIVFTVPDSLSCDLSEDDVGYGTGNNIGGGINFGIKATATANYTDVIIATPSTNSDGTIGDSDDPTPSISSASGDFDLYSPANITFTLSDMGILGVSKVEMGIGALSQLTSGDYSYSSGTLTINSSYLTGLSIGDYDVKVTLDDNTTELTAILTVTDSTPTDTPITAVTISLAHPVPLATPATTASVTVGNASFDSISWAGSPASFGYSTPYTANITLNANSGNTFTGLTDGNVTISDTGSGATVASKTITANAGSSMTVQVVFNATPAAPTYTVGGTYSNPGVTAISLTDGGNTYNAVLTSGSYTITGVPAGSYTVSVTYDTSNGYIADTITGTGYSGGTLTVSTTGVSDLNITAKLEEFTVGGAYDANVTSIKLTNTSTSTDYPVTLTASPYSVTVPYGTYTISVTHNAGYGTSIAGIPQYVSGTLTVHAAVSGLDITSTANSYTLTVTSGGDGTVQIGSGSAGTSVTDTVTYNDTRAITAIPDTGYKFTGWSGDYTGTANPYTYTMPSNNATIMASFAPKVASAVTSGTLTIAHVNDFSTANTITVTLNDYAASDITAISFGGAPLTEGADYSITDNGTTATITLDAGFWNAADITAGDNNKYFTITAGGGSLQVQLQIINIYTVTVAAGTGGTASGGGTVIAGGSVSITATPTSGTGYQFGNWTSDNGGTFGSSTADSTTFTPAAAATTVTANFTTTDINAAAVTVTAPPTTGDPRLTTIPTSGTITTGSPNFIINNVAWSPSDTYFQYSAVYTVTITLTADTGYVFASGTYTINGQSPSNSPSYGGTTLTLTYTFPITTLKWVTGIAVGSGDQWSYANNNTFVVPTITLTYNDSTSETVPVTNLGSRGITLHLDSAAGTVIDGSTSLGSAHDGRAVYAVYTPGSDNSDTVDTTQGVVSASIGTLDVSTVKINTVNVNVTAPATGGTPNAVGDLTAPVNTTVNSVAWYVGSGTTTPMTDAAFAAGQIYTVAVVLDADSTHSFDNTMTATINSAGSTSHTGAGTARLTLTYTFAAATAPTLGTPSAGTATATGAQITFDSTSALGGTYYYVVDTNGTAPGASAIAGSPTGTGALATGTSQSNSFTVNTTLLPNTTYYVHITALATGAGDYAVPVTVSFTTPKAPINSAAITITAPVSGAISGDATTADTTFSIATVTGTAWTPDITTTLTDKFLGGVAYTATITLTAGTNYEFDSGFSSANITLSGTGTSGTIQSVTPDSGGTFATVVISFPATIKLVSSIAATGSPALSYNSGDSFAYGLTGATLTFNDDTSVNVPLANFAGYGISFKYGATPTDITTATTMTRAAHDGQTLYLYYTPGSDSTTGTGSNTGAASCNASLGVLTVATASINAVSVTGLTAPAANTGVQAVGGLSTADATYTITGLTWYEWDGATPSSIGTTPVSTFDYNRYYVAVIELTQAGETYFPGSGISATIDGVSADNITYTSGTSISIEKRFTASTDKEPITGAAITIGAPVGGAASANASASGTGVDSGATTTAWNNGITVPNTFAYGTVYTATVVLTPETDYEFAASMNNNTSSVTVNNGTVQTVALGGDGKVTVTILFTATANPALTIQAGTNGTVSSTAAATYPSGTTIILKDVAAITPDSGYKFSTWVLTTGTGALSDAGVWDTANYVTDNGPATLTVNFAAKTAALTSSTPSYDKYIPASQPSFTFDNFADYTLVSVTVGGQTFTGGEFSVAGTTVTLTDATKLDLLTLSVSQTVTFVMDDTAGNTTSTMEVKDTTPTAIPNVTISIAHPVATATAGAAAATSGTTGVASLVTAWNETGTPGVDITGTGFAYSALYTATITLTPTTGSAFAPGITESDITVNPATGATVRSANIVGDDLVVEIEFTATADPTLTVNAGTGGTASGSGSYAVGATPTITATAASGYKFFNWTTSDGGTITNANSASTTYTMPNNNAAVTANFAAKTAALTSSTPSYDKYITASQPSFTFNNFDDYTLVSVTVGGQTFTSGDFSVVGTTVTLTDATKLALLTLGASQTVTFVMDDTAGNTTSTMEVKDTTPTAIPNVTINIAHPVATATADAAAATSGTTGVASLVTVWTETGTPGVDITGTGFAYSALYTATITLTPTTGSAFAPGITESDITVNPATGATVRSASIVGNDLVVVIDFTATADPTLTVNSGTGGTASGSGSYAVGATPTITATAASGYKFFNWTTSDGGTITNANSASTTYTMPNNNATVTANFAAKTAATLTTTTANYNITTGSGGITFTFSGLGDYAFASAGAILIGGTALTLTTDYTVNGNNITVLHSALTGLSVGGHAITFAWDDNTFISPEASPTATLTIQETLDTFAVAVTAPVTGVSSSTAATAGTGYTATAAWYQGATPFSGSFAAGQIYTVEVTLTPDTNYDFNTTIASAAINGEAGTTVVSGNTSASITLRYTFVATAPAITGIAGTPSGSTADISFDITSAIAGEYWYLVSTSSSVAAAAVQDGATGTLATGTNTYGPFSVSAPAAGTTYYIHVVAQATDGTLSAVATGSFATPGATSVTVGLTAGVIEYGNTITATVSGSPTGTLTYTWYTEKDGYTAPIKTTGGTASTTDTYEAAAADIGYKIKVVVTETGATGAPDSTIASSVEQKTVSYTVTAANKVYNGSDAIATVPAVALVSGSAINGDELFVALASGWATGKTFSSANAGAAYNINTADVELSGANSVNYRLTSGQSVPGGTIEQATIDLSANSALQTQLDGLVPDNYVGASAAITLSGITVDTGVGSENIIVNFQFLYTNGTAAASSSSPVTVTATGKADGTGLAANYNVVNAYITTGEILGDQVLSISITTQPNLSYTYGDDVTTTAGKLNSIIYNVEYASGRIEYNQTYSDLSTHSLGIRFKEDSSALPADYFAWNETRTLEIYTTGGTEVTEAITSTITLSPRELTASATWSGSKIYDSSATVSNVATDFTVILGNYASGDTQPTADLTSASAAFNSANVASANLITLTGIGESYGDGRYTVADATIAATIAPKPLTAAIPTTGVAKTYNGNATYVGTPVSTGEGSITITPTYTFADANADESGNKVISNITYALSDTSGNYVIATGLPATATGSINKAEITSVTIKLADVYLGVVPINSTVSDTGVTAAFSGAAHAITAAAGRVGSDNITITFDYKYNVLNAAANNVALYDIANVTLTGGTVSDNYTLSGSLTATGSVNVLANTTTSINSVSMADGQYPEDLDFSALTIDVTETAGPRTIIGYDNIVAAGYAIVISYPGGGGSVSGTSTELAGQKIVRPEAGDYNINIISLGNPNANKGRLVKVDPIVIILDDLLPDYGGTKDYDATTSVKNSLGTGDAAFDATANGKIEDGDVVTIGVTFYYDNMHAGTGKTIRAAITVGGADAGNYSIPTGTHVLTNAGEITQASITLTGSDFSNIPDTSVGVSGWPAPHTITLPVGIGGENVFISYTYSYDNTNKADSAAAVTIGSATSMDYVITVTGDATGVVNPPTISTIAITSGSMLAVEYGTGADGSSNTYFDLDTVTFTLTAGSTSYTGVSIAELVNNYGYTVTIGGNTYAPGSYTEGSNLIPIAWGTTLTLGATKTANASYSGTVRVTPRQLEANTATATEKNYDGNTSVPDLSATTFTKGILSGDESYVTVTANAAYTSANAGTTDVNVTFTLGGSYTARYTAPATQNIYAGIGIKAIQLTPDVTVTASTTHGYIDITSANGYLGSKYDILEGGTTPVANPVTVTGTITGVNGEKIAFTGTVTYTDVTPGLKNVTLAIAAGGVSNANYTFTSFSDALTTTTNLGQGNVVKKSVSGITAVTDPSKMTYTYITDDEIDFTGMSFTVTYDNGTSVTFTHDGDGWNTNEPGTDVDLADYDVKIQINSADCDGELLWEYKNKSIGVFATETSVFANTVAAITINPYLVEIEEVTFSGKTYDGTDVATAVTNGVTVKAGDAALLLTDGVTVNTAAVTAKFLITGTETYAKDVYWTTSAQPKDVQYSGLSLSGTNAERFTLNDGTTDYSAGTALAAATIGQRSVTAASIVAASTSNIWVPTLIEGESYTGTSTVDETDSLYYFVGLGGEYVYIGYTITYTTPVTAPSYTANISSVETLNTNYAITGTATKQGNVLSDVPQGIRIATQPKLTYIYGEPADLSDIVVEVQWTTGGPWVSYTYDELSDTGITMYFVDDGGGTSIITGALPNYFPWGSDGKKVQVSIMGADDSGNPTPLIDVTTNALTIIPRPIYVTINALDKQYDGNNTAAVGATPLTVNKNIAGYEITTSVLDDDHFTVAAATGAAYSFAQTNAGNDIAVSTSLVPTIDWTGKSADSATPRYTILLANVTGKADITPKTVYISASDITVTTVPHGATGAALTVDLVGTNKATGVGIETLSFTLKGTYQTTGTGGVANYITTPHPSITLNTATAAITSAASTDTNYVLSFTGYSMTGEVVPAKITAIDVTGIPLPTTFADAALNALPVAGSNYTVTSSAWTTGALDSGKFIGGTTYTATITVQANNGYYFDDISRPTIASTAAGTYAITSVSTAGTDNNMNTLTFTVTYDPTANTYTVIYDTQGGSVIAPTTVLTIQNVSRPATDPTRSGYEFVNWYDTAGTATDSTTWGSVITWPLSSTATAYAQWKKTIVTSTDNVTVSVDVGSSAAYNLSGLITDGAGTYTYAVESGALPSGVSLDPATGAITGTPATGTAGGYSVVVTITASDGATYDITVNVNVNKVANTAFIMTEPAPSGTSGSVNMHVGGDYSIETAYNKGTVTYTGYDSSLISVNSSGKITGLAVGITTITVTDPGDADTAPKSYTVRVNIELANMPLVNPGSVTYDLNTSAAENRDNPSVELTLGDATFSKIMLDDGTGILKELVLDTDYTMDNGAYTFLMGSTKLSLARSETPYTITFVMLDSFSNIIELDVELYVIDTTYVQGTVSITSTGDINNPKVGDVLTAVPNVTSADIDANVKYNWQYKNSLGGWTDIEAANISGDGKILTIPESLADAEIRFIVTEDGYDGVIEEKFTVAAKDTPVTPPGGGGGSGDLTVTYVIGEGGFTKDAKSEKVAEGETPASVPKVTAMDGYAFLGWTQDGKTLVNPIMVTITEDTTFTAVLSEVKFHFAYLQGYGDNQIRPSGNITRAEVATIVARLISESMYLDGTYASTFSDVKSGEWYSDYIGFIESLGIINGYEDGTFRPNAYISREEFAKVIAETARYLGVINDVLVGTPSFADANIISDWAVNYIYTAQQNGWMTGYNNKVEPLRSITRAETTKVVNEMLGRVIDANSIAGHGYINFSDLPSGDNAWALYYMIEASNDHYCAGFGGMEYWVSE